MTALTHPLATALALAALASAAARADDEPGAARVERCTLEASALVLTGDARDRFIAACAKADPGSGSSIADAPPAQFRACNLQASNRHLDGDARAHFIEACLKGE